MVLTPLNLPRLRHWLQRLSARRLGLRSNGLSSYEPITKSADKNLRTTCCVCLRRLSTSERKLDKKNSATVREQHCDGSKRISGQSICTGTDNQIHNNQMKKAPKNYLWEANRPCYSTQNTPKRTRKADSKPTGVSPVVRTARLRDSLRPKCQLLRQSHSGKYVCLSPWQMRSGYCFPPVRLSVCAYFTVQKLKNYQIEIDVTR